MYNYKMFVRQWWLVPRLHVGGIIDKRSQYVMKNNFRCAKSLSHFSRDEGTPLKASLLTCGNQSLSPHRGISCSMSLSSGNTPVKDSPKRLKSKWKRRSNHPLITAAGIIDSVFEKKTTAVVLPSNLSGQQDKVKDPTNHLGTIRRREFLTDSAGYRSSSLEIFKQLEQKYNKDDEEKLEQFIEEATAGKMSLFSSSGITSILSSFSCAPLSTISSMYSVSFKELSSLACQNCKTCTDEEFCNVLLALYKMPVLLTPEQREVLEGESERRLHSWDVNTMLLVSDWCICLQRKSPFNQVILGALSTKLEEMTLQNIIQTFYVIGECQYVPSEEFLQKLTDLVEQRLDSFTWNEVGVVCNAFIKSRSRILSLPLQQYISSRICQDLYTNSLDHYNLVTAMRFISRAYFHNWRLFEAMAHSLTPHIPDMPFLVPPHIATSFAKVRHFNKPLMDAIASRALQTDDNIRLKDIWMLLWAYCRLNYDPPNSKDFFPRLIHQLADKLEQQDQPFQFIKSLVSLTFIGQYPLALIDNVFSPQSLQEYEEKCPKDVYKHLYTLDCSVAIEQPNYHGNRLPQAFIDKFWQSPHGSKNVSYDKIPGLQEALQGLQCILGGTEYLKAHPILPHIRTPVDIEVHLDSSSNPLPLHSKSSCSSEELVSKPLDESGQDNVTKLAVLVAPKAHYRLYSRDLLGVHVMKRRQLRKVGYKIIEVPYYQWLPLLRASESKRHDYLQAKVFT